MSVPSLAEINDVLIKLKGAKVGKPKGQSAGHASGLPFEQLIHNHLSENFNKRVLRQHEALNKVLLANPNAVTEKQRIELLGASAIQFLTKRGKLAMTNWTSSAQFAVKQDDTAESIIFPNEKCDFFSEKLLLIDVKTQDLSKKAQAPNIISADKLARACVLGLHQKQSIPFDIIYVGIKWLSNQSSLVIEDIKAISLMKINPGKIYINWVAAQQIQFHPFEVDQTFNRNSKEWCTGYLNSFSNSLESRIEKEIERLEYFRNALS
jgi:type II restriction enzyme